MATQWWTCLTPGCRARNKPEADECENCGEPPPNATTARGPKITGFPCQDCGEITNVRLGAIVVDEKFLCSDCHFIRLKRESSTRGQRCGVDNCDQTIDQHITAFTKTMAGWRLDKVRSFRGDLATVEQKREALERLAGKAR